MKPQPLLRLPAKTVIGCIRQYKKYMSPWLGDMCRFYPSCADYAAIVIDSHGLFRGGWLAIKRICKCHPYHSGGIDEPPQYPQ